MAILSSVGLFHERVSVTELYKSFESPGYRPGPDLSILLVIDRAECELPAFIIFVQLKRNKCSGECAQIKNRGPCIRFF